MDNKEFCNKCGAEIPKESIFCNKCGEKIVAKEKKIKIVSDDENYISENKPKKHIAKTILCVLLVVFLIYLLLKIIAYISFKRDLKTNYFIENDGTTVLVSDYGNSYTLKQLPKNLKYNDKSILLETIEFYQDKNNYVYDLYAIVTLNLSELSDEEIYWMLKNNDLDYYSIDIDSEKNEYKDKPLSYLNKSLQNSELKLLFYLQEDSRYSFESGTFDFNFQIKQSEKYTDDKGNAYNKRISYSYYDENICEEGNTLPSTEELDEITYKAMYDGFEGIKDYWKTQLYYSLNN